MDWTLVGIAIAIGGVLLGVALLRAGNSGGKTADGDELDEDLRIW